MASPSPASGTSRWCGAPAPRTRPARAGRLPSASGSRWPARGSGTLPSARSNSLRRPSPSIVLRIGGGVAPCVGRPSVTMKTLSGAATSGSSPRNAFSRLVPSCGTVRRSSRSTSLSACASLAVEPAARAARHQRPRLRVERDDLELRLRRNLRGEPVDGGDGAPPLLGRHAGATPACCAAGSR